MLLLPKLPTHPPRPALPAPSRPHLLLRRLLKGRADDDDDGVVQRSTDVSIKQTNHRSLRQRQEAAATRQQRNVRPVVVGAEQFHDVAAD